MDLHLVWHYFRHNMMSAMAYRGAFLMQMVGMLLNDVMLLFFWWVFFTRLPTLHGWTFQGVAGIYATVAFAYGLGTVVCGNALRVARTITSGDLDYYLALPANPLVHLLVSRMSLSAWGDVLFGLLVFLLATPERWRLLPLFLLLGMLAALTLIAFGVLVGSLAFWVGNAENLATQAINALVTFGIYPVEIFPGIVQLALYTVIPAALLGSLPASLLVQFDWGHLGLLVGATVLLLLLAGWTFRRGLHRYESGNLVTTRGY